MSSVEQEDIIILQKKLQKISSECEKLVNGINLLENEAKKCVQQLNVLRNPTARETKFHNNSDKLDLISDIIIKLNWELELSGVSSLSEVTKPCLQHISVNTSTSNLKYLTGDSPWNFWLQVNSLEIKTLHKLLIEKHESGELQNCVSLPPIGESVCYAERRRVFRGVVTQHLGNTRLKVIDVDTGCVKVLSLDKVYHVDEDVCELNAQAIKCCLSKDFDSSCMWTSDLGSMFTNSLNIRNGSLHVNIRKQLPGFPPQFVVDIKVENEEEEGELNVNEWIFERVLPELKDVYIEGVETLCDFLSPKALDPYFQDNSPNVLHSENFKEIASPDFNDKSQESVKLKSVDEVETSGDLVTVDPVAYSSRETLNRSDSVNKTTDQSESSVPNIIQKNYESTNNKASVANKSKSATVAHMLETSVAVAVSSEVNTNSLVSVSCGSDCKVDDKEQPENLSPVEGLSVQNDILSETSLEEINQIKSDSNNRADNVETSFDLLFKTSPSSGEHEGESSPSVLQSQSSSHSSFFTLDKVINERDIESLAEKLASNEFAKFKEKLTTEIPVNTKFISCPLVKNVDNLNVYKETDSDSGIVVNEIGNNLGDVLEEQKSCDLSSNHDKNKDGNVENCINNNLPEKIKENMILDSENLTNNINWLSDAQNKDTNLISKNKSSEPKKTFDLCENDFVQLENSQGSDSKLETSTLNHKSEKSYSSGNKLDASSSNDKSDTPSSSDKPLLENVPPEICSNRKSKTTLTCKGKSQTPHTFNVKAESFLSNISQPPLLPYPTSQGSPFYNSPYLITTFSPQQQSPFQFQQFARQSMPPSHIPALWPAPQPQFYPHFQNRSQVSQPWGNFNFHGPDIQYNTPILKPPETIPYSQWSSGVSEPSVSTSQSKIEMCNEVEKETSNEKSDKTFSEDKNSTANQELTTSPSLESTSTSGNVASVDYVPDNIEKVTENYHVKLKHPRTLLKPNESMLVMIAHVESPGQFYVHVVVENNFFIDKLRDEMFAYYSKSTLVLNKSCEEAKAKYGKYCACKWPEDGHWYRVEVIDWRENSVYIYFVDYGNHDDVPLSSIQPLVKQFTEHAMMAQPCHLANVYPSDSVFNLWSDEAIFFFSSQFQEDDAYKAVVVPSNSNQSSNSLAVQLFKLDDQKKSVSVNNLMVRKGYAVRKRKLSLQSNTNSAGEMEVEESVTDNSVMNTSFDEENDWDNWNPLGEDYESSLNCFNVDQENANFAVTGYKGKDETNICSFFAEKGKCWKKICRKKHVYSYELPDIRGSALNVLKLPNPGEIVQIKITFFCSIDRFYAQLQHSKSALKDEEEEETLETLSVYMNKRSKVREMKPLDVPPIVGQLVIAKSSAGYWFRARVLESSTDSKVEVMFVDYGTEEVVHEQDLRQIEKKYLHLPFQAVECYLVNVRPVTNEKVNNKAVEILKTNFIGIPLYAQIKSSYDALCRLEVHLQDAENIDVGSWLIEKKLCESSESVEKRCVYRID